MSALSIAVNTDTSSIANPAPARPRLIRVADTPIEVREEQLCFGITWEVESDSPTLTPPDEARAPGTTPPGTTPAGTTPADTTPARPTPAGPAPAESTGPTTRGRGARRAATPAPPPPALPAVAAPDEWWVGQIALNAMEVVVGVRSATQLNRHLAPRMVTKLAEERPAIGRTHKGNRPTLRKVRTQMPAPHAIEAAAVVAIGSRSRAVAMRLEYMTPAATPNRRGTPLDPRWLVTELDVL